MRIQIRKKLLLVLAVAATQAFCLGWGVIVFDSWLENSIRETVHQQVLKENVQTAQQMAKLIREMEVEDPRQSFDSWNRLQDAVRGINLPNEGFVCLVDSGSGGLICHPELRSHPTLGETGMAKKPMAGKEAGFAKAAMMAEAEKQKQEAMAHLAEAKKPMMKKAPTGVEIGATSGGVVDTKEGLQIIAATELPNINARLLVHQLGRGIDVAVARIMEPVKPIGLAVSLGLVALTTVAVTGVVRRYENRLAEINEGLEELVVQRTRSLMRTRNGLIFGLAKLAESRDTDTGEHLDRIAKYVTILANQLKEDGIELSDTDVEHLALASSLHDIGKVGVPDAVLLKPGRLDAEERKIIETHATIGGDCLQALSEQLGEDDFLQTAEEIAYGHHEKWDGSGYPFQRAGEQIPLSARIVAVADVYDALRSKRPYKEGMSHEKAKGILLKDAGSHFDPVVVEAFLAAEEAVRGVQPEAEASQPDESLELATV